MRRADPVPASAGVRRRGPSGRRCSGRGRTTPRPPVPAARARRGDRARCCVRGRARPAPAVRPSSRPLLRIHASP
ncbi:hypothetical protein DYE20_01130 [[Mycobacterium] chelonae subsp. gwanakae]|nr:hypothetical protein DYE20_01130 [[Mycobacterium] chelonae subsp. gwanakae]